MIETELAYAAGLFEGEGTVFITQTPRQFFLTVAVSMTDPEPVEWLHSRWGGGLTTRRKSRDNPKAKDQRCWTATAGIAGRFLEDIRPYLVSGRERERARLGIEFQAQKSRNQSINRTPEYRAAQAEYRDALRAVPVGGA